MRVAYPSLIQRSVLIGLIAASTSGCSTLTPDECLYADWYERGEQDAAAGLPLTRILDYNRDCNLHGINPDRWDFMLGWKAGARRTAS